MNRKAAQGNAYWAVAYNSVYFALLAVGVFCLVILTIVATVGVWLIWSNSDQIKDGINMMANGGDMARVARKWMDQADEGLGGISLAQVIHGSLPQKNTTEFLSEDLAKVAAGLRDLGLIASDAKKVDIVGVITPILQFCIKLAGKKETAIAASAMTDLTVFVAKQAQEGNVNLLFSITKTVVLIFVDALKKPSVQASLHRIQHSLDTMLDDEKVKQAFDDFADMVHEVKVSDMLSHATEGLAVLRNVTEVAQEVRDDIHDMYNDFGSGGVQFSMNVPGLENRMRNKSKQAASTPPRAVPPPTKNT